MNRNRSYLVAFWSPFSVSDPEPCMGYVSSFLRRFGDIQCINCGDLSDRRYGRLLHQADLVVIAVRQNRGDFCRLFCENMIRFPNCIWLITDYMPGIAPDRSMIMFEFRIPSSRLACITYSPLLREKRAVYGPTGPCLPGCRAFVPADRFISEAYAKKIPSCGPLSSDTRRELNDIGHTILQALGF